MALIDDAVFAVGSGHFYTAVTGTAAPTDLLAPPIAWSEIGHTSLEDILSLSSEGGEATVLGTLQKKNLRTTYSARTESLSITLQQFDKAALQLYYGSNAADMAVDSQFIGVPGDPQPTVKAFLAVFTDGAQVFALYAPKSEIFRGDDMEFSDTESLAGLPLNVKPVNYLTNTYAFAVTPLEALA